MNIKENNKHFKTTNFYLAAFLYAQEIVLADIDKSEKRYKFIFLNSPKIKKLAESFVYAPDNSKDAKIDARRFINSIKTLKDKIYQDGF